MRWNWLLTLTLAAALAACGDGGGDDTSGDGGPDGSTDTDTDADAGTDTDTDTDTGPDPALDCVDLGLPSVPFVDVAETTALKGDAADFTVPTTAGDWNLKAHWSGCESYLFLPENPAQNAGAYGYHYWDFQIDFTNMFAATPKNVHYFFVPDSGNTDIEGTLAALAAKVGVAVASLPAEDQAWWADHVHYVTAPPSALSNYVGALLASPRWGFGIDRAQRIRYIGSFGDPSRLNSTVGWFGPNVGMVTNEAIYYNFEADREERLAAEDATAIPLWDMDPVATSGNNPVDVDLPDAETMAGFDTLEFDMGMTCVGEGEYGDCPAWDYDVYLYLCDEGDPTICDAEVGHWITSCHREGRWVHDASAILPLLASGGTRRFQISVSDPWEITFSLRFSNQGKAARPSETYDLFAGQYTFDENYNTNYTDVVMPIPADAIKVEIASVITGHGMAPPANCCEFANTDHHFIVNGVDNVQDFPIVEDTRGCMAQVADGTVPNQYGTWWYGRAGWCPGKHVPIVMTDVTAEVTLGADNTFGYEGFYLGAPYVGTDSSWRHIHLTSWVVISR
jgi:hypothetical protein